MEDSLTISDSIEVSSKTFNSSVSALTSAFGDSTRRDIYLMIREKMHTTVAEIAQDFKIHPNVARHHLDKLTSGGYLEVSLVRFPGQKAGRPSKLYSITKRDVVSELPGRQVDLLAQLVAKLLKVVDRNVAQKLASEVGFQHGRQLAEQMLPDGSYKSIKKAIESVANALTADGFNAYSEMSEGETHLISGSCPFGDLAMSNPVICAIEGGMVSGLLAGLSGEKVSVKISSKARGDSICQTVV